MKLSLSSLVFALLFSFLLETSASTDENFIQCLTLHSGNDSISKLIYTSSNSLYSSILKSSIRNTRFSTPSTPKPQVIVTPLLVSHIQETLNCSQKHGLQVRFRSGGHDYEGLSYASPVPFVILDLINFRNISVDVKNSFAWVQSGATLGELYYWIANKSRTLGFPAGVCPTIGVGGHFSGGEYGTLLRKYGLAADNVIDAHLIDVKVADKFDTDLFIRVILSAVSSSQKGNRTVQASFNSLYLGGKDKLLPLMQKSFPELGLVSEDCTEMSWIQSILYFAGFPSGLSPDILLNRDPSITYFKAKSDYVKNPIPEVGLEGIWQRLLEKEAATALLILSPYGGRMNEISEFSIPFPHRAGNIYKIQHLVYWTEEGTAPSEKYISWIRRLYDYMAPFVSKSPREAYINYRDLDIGTNNISNTSHSQASIWGTKYFKNNFERLVQVKTLVDPANFFRNEQSIPPVSY
ncbi:hypothetical protein SO802_007071 [Lithocarpus litseifolius]|uniref:FAD-binding PCMH-type domain-containing protein n=1 Tax=Lithocarpus litseifolius TaxID=425828 RepID=A0AAW2DQW9_9ROSI